MPSDAVRLTVRIPQSLATQVAAYATTHSVTMSQLVRAGLAHILTQPPTSVTPKPPPPPPPPRSITPALRAGLALRRRIERVLKAHPDGIDVGTMTDALNAGTSRTSRTRLTRVQVGSHLRHQYRMGHIGRLERGVYVS